MSPVMKPAAWAAGTPGQAVAVRSICFTLVEAALHSLAAGRIDGDVTIAARALWSGVHGICILERTGRLGPVAAKDLVDSLVTNYLRGLGTP